MWISKAGRTPDVARHYFFSINLLLFGFFFGGGFQNNLGQSQIFTNEPLEQKKLNKPYGGSVTIINPKRQADGGLGEGPSDHFRPSPPWRPWWGVLFSC